MSFFSFLHSQLFLTLPTPSTDYTGKTVIVTGSNVGLGLEAARHFARLNATRVILAVRNVEAGEAARKNIMSSTKRPAHTVQVWRLDMASYDSVKSFAARAAKELDRIDVVCENAGLAKGKFTRAEGNETSIVVNVISTFLLLLLLLPKLRETGSKFNILPVVSITSSEVAGWAKFNERHAPEGKLFKYLASEEKSKMDDRYQTSKLLEVLHIAAIGEEKSAEQLGVIVNCLNPGLCHSSLSREGPLMVHVIKFLLARTTEAGSRTIVHAASSGPETHGKYLSDCKLATPAGHCVSPERPQLQKRVWKELLTELERIEPGVTKNL